MSVAPLKKLTVIGRIADKGTALEALQALGCLHLIPLSPPPPEPETAASREAEDAYKALRFLNDVAEPRRQVKRAPDFDVEHFVADVLALKQTLREASDRRDFLAARIKAVAPWGDLVFPPKTDLAGFHLWFYQLPVKHRDALGGVDLPWTVVNRDARFDYVVVLSHDEPPADLLPVPRTHTGALPITELKAQLEEAEIELEGLQAERVAMTRYLTLLRRDLSKAATLAERAFAREQTLDDDGLFILQGWVPVEAVAGVTAYTEDVGLALLIEEPTLDETPPTLLVQPDHRTSGVDLALFYQVPNYRAWDPTLLLVASFSIFFAMIVADAGYGILILVGILLYRNRLSGTARLRSWRRLGLVLSATTIAYGVLVGSYFGAAPPEGSFLAGFAILSLQDFDTMMRLSVIVGVIHIVIANAMSAWVNRARRSSLARVGWIGVILGGLILWLSGQAGFAGTLGVGLLVIGFAAVVWFSSDRPVATPLDRAWRLVDGIKSLGGAMGAFGDVLSYMRLFALGLASASLALTFNDLAVSTAEAVPGLGVLLALLILVVGHALNFALALLSGVVHGLRLNFIEFYKWGLPEEGVAFRPFARKEIQE